MEKGSERKQTGIMLIRNCGNCRYWEPDAGEDSQWAAWTGKCMRPWLDENNRERETMDWCPYHEARNA